MRPLFITLISALLVISCNKADKDKTADDKTAPEITILGPAAGTEYLLGDTIYFKADIEDESELSELAVNLLVEGDTVLMWPDPPVLLGNITSYTIDAWWVNTYNIHEDASIEFVATDKRDNTGRATVAILLDE